MPTNPKRLQVIDRIVTVLQAITAGANYFYTPARVARRVMDYDECDVFPCLMVTTGDGGKAIEYAGEHLYDETFNISIKGFVRDDADPNSAMEKMVRDIRYAINQDTLNGVSGALGDGVLCVQCVFRASPDTDNGFLSQVGLAYFDQQVEVTVSGNWGEI
jgi:hypothetical protein